MKGTLMDELERRLRAAMLAAAEPAPPGLVEAIRRRHRRYRIRVGAGSVAVVAAIGAVVVPFVQQHPASPGGSGLRGGATPSARPHPTAASSMARFTCNDAWDNDTWRPHGLRTGPLWLIPASGQRALDVEVADGATVTLQIPAASQSQLKFVSELYSFGAASLLSHDTGITFTSCRGPAGDFTRFGVGFSLPAGHSAIADVSVPGTRHPTRVIFTCTRSSCRLAHG